MQLNINNSSPHHQRDSVSSQAVGQQLCQLAVPVWDVHASRRRHRPGPGPGPGPGGAAAAAAAAAALRAELRDAVPEHHEALVDVVGLLQRLPFAARLLGHLRPRQVHKVDLPVPGDVDALAVLPGRLLLRVDVHGQDGVGARGVLVHVVTPDGAVLQPLLQDGDQVVQLLAVDGEEVVDDEGAAAAVPPDAQVRPLRPRIQEVNHLRGERERERASSLARVERPLLPL